MKSVAENLTSVSIEASVSVSASAVMSWTGVEYKHDDGNMRQGLLAARGPLFPIAWNADEYMKKHAIIATEKSVEVVMVPRPCGSVCADKPILSRQDHLHHPTPLDEKGQGTISKYEHRRCSIHFLMLQQLHRTRNSCSAAVSERREPPSRWLTSVVVLSKCK